MQLHINQHLFSFADTYDITDTVNNRIYQVQGHPFAIGKRLDLMDAAGNVVATIQQRVISLVEEYDILQGDQIQAVVKKDLFNLFHPHYSVNGPAGAYEMEGDWAGWSYAIRSNGQTIAQITPELSLAGKYGIEIVEGADVPLLLCLAIVVDEISH